MPIVVEYLVIFRRNDSFCDSVASFTRLLQVDSDISVNKGTIKYKDDFSCGYQIVSGEVAGKDQRFFQLKFSWSASTEASPPELENFSALLKTVRGVIGQVGGQIETLWDDISFYYARAAYPLIHEIESLMRKLIANFMLITVGREWIKETSPEEIEEAIRKSKRKDQNFINVLHTVDFIHLGDFLFRPYSKKTTQDLHARLKEAKSLEDYTTLKEFIPLSNWKRYFTDLVDCDDSYLDKRWQELYDLRCKVAHNAIMTKIDYDRTVHLIGEVKPKLLDAISKLPKVSVPADELEVVAESAAKNVNAALGEFITTWQHLEWILLNRFTAAGRSVEPGDTASVWMIREGHQILKGDQLALYHEVRKFRNRAVHGHPTTLSPEVIQRYTASAQMLIHSLEGQAVSG